jgi:hypothetical protein
MTRSVLAVISDLEKHVEKHAGVLQPDRPTHTTASGPVACVAGRGPFDDVVTAMLAQLLAQRGVATRRIQHRLVSRELIEQLDLSDVKVITVSCLELAGAPAHMRYLIRRIRDRVPNAWLIAGLWSQGESALKDPDVQRALGADRYVGSMRDALEASVAALSEPSEPVRKIG